MRLSYLITTENLVLRFFGGDREGRADSDKNAKETNPCECRDDSPLKIASHFSS